MNRPSPHNACSVYSPYASFPFSTYNLDVHLDVLDSLGQGSSRTGDGHNPGLELDLNALGNGKSLDGRKVLHFCRRCFGGELTGYVVDGWNTRAEINPSQRRR